MLHDELLYWIWLSLRVGIANYEFVRLLDYYETPFEIYSAESEEISRIEGISPQLADSLSNKNIDDARRYQHYCARYGIGILTYGDPRYPVCLKKIQNPPVLLYFKGTLPDFDTVPAVSIVGTRKMSEYGKQMAYKISYELASAGITVVSGMALGIDGVASCGALEAGGTSVVVLGSGIDVIYPKEHARLMDLIIHNGAVVSEYPIGTRPDGDNFPIRNRLISAFSESTVVIEGDYKSGALITARHALIQGREVYAVPGNIDEINAQGTNNLLQTGATMIVSAEDIMKQYRKTYGDRLNELAYDSARHSCSDCDRALARMKVHSRIYGYNYNTHPTPGTEDSIAEAQRQSLVARATVPDRGKPKPVRDAATAPRKAAADPTPQQASPQKAPASPNGVTAPRPEKAASVQSTAKLTELQEKILVCFPLDECISLDQIVRMTDLPTQTVALNLTILTIAGVVRSLPGGMYQRL
ncbi:MAG: DNA-processing protein DprA [Clostridia bacterium]|nr:DNA-processing protein DprA [Clostridia bacterium]